MTGKVSERLWKNRSRRDRTWGVSNVPPEDPLASRIPSHHFLISANSVVMYISILSIVVNHRLIKTTVITTLYQHPIIESPSY